MHILLWIIWAALFNTLIGLVGALILLFKKSKIDKLTRMLIAFSAGTLLGGAFFHLLAESIEGAEALTAFAFAIIGFMAFYLIEGYFHWHRCKHCEHPFTYNILIGDSIHNIIDGMVIAASFMANIPLGIITTLVILSHEAPQQIGLFAVLLYGKYSNAKALVSSLIAQSTCIIGTVIGYFISATATNFLIPFAAGGFIYISASDLVPEMHKMHEGDFKTALKTIIPFAFGILLLALTKVLLE